MARWWWDFCLCSQQQLICVILLLRWLPFLISTTASIQGLQKSQRIKGEKEVAG